MKSVYESYLHLWPEHAKERLKPLLSEVMVLRYPEDKKLVRSLPPQNIVLVVRDVPVSDLIQFLRLGFRHVVQEKRLDFAQELLASGLMLAKNKAFMNNPIPFFLSGFSTDDLIRDPDRHLILRFTRQSEKETVLDWLNVFLERQQNTLAIRDICMQAADEMINNALFNAPVRRGKTRLFKDLPRDADIALPTAMGGKLFVCFAEERVVVGCADAYGSLQIDPLLDHLAGLFSPGGAKFKTTGGGAGLGVRNMVENAANFYTLVEPGQFTIMACTYMLKGLKSNISQVKNLHLGLS
jgi:hypothetical protein